MNDYKDEFDQELTPTEFILWLNTQVQAFIGNVCRVPQAKPKTLREWISWFIDWVEYGENK